MSLCYTQIPDEAEYVIEEFMQELSRREMVHGIMQNIQWIWNNMKTHGTICCE